MALTPNVKFKSRQPNWVLLNAIRNDASAQYQRQVPEATQADQSAAIKAIDKFRPIRNEFVDALVNQIGLIKFTSDAYFNNPLKKFKQGMLEHGDTVEEIGTGLVEAYTFEARENVGEAELFGQADFDVQSSFHRINRQEKYKVTIQRAILKRAFSTEYGISELVSRIMDAPTKSNERDEFIQMANLFRAMDAEGAFYRINTPDVAASTSTEAQVKSALRSMRGLAGNLPFISTKYNPAGLPVSANADDMELFITPEANAAIDVDALASLFNIERAQVPYRQTLIPAEFFPDGVWAILTTKDFFQVFDTLMETATMQNPGGLYDNYWLHVHQIISASRFVPLVAFTTGPGTEDEITEFNPTSVDDIVVRDGETGEVVAAGTELARGKYFQVLSRSVDAASDITGAVRWTVSGLTSDQSFINQNGLLYPSPFERGDAIVVTATAVDDGTLSKTRAFNLSGDIASLWNPIDVLPDPGATA